MQYKIVNKANIVFAKIVAEVVEINRSTMMPVRILEKAVVLLTKLGDYEKLLIFTSTLSNIDFVTKIAEDVISQKERINVELTQALGLKLETLHATVNFAVSKKQLEKQRVIIKNLHKLVEVYESEANKKEQDPEKRKTSEDFIELTVPYFTHNGVWDETTYDVDRKEFNLQHPTKRLKVSLSGLSKYTINELAKHGDIDRVMLVDSGKEITSAKIFVEDLEKLSTDGLTETVEQKLISGSKISTLRETVMITFVRKVRIALNCVPEKNKTKITLTAAASPEHLYGKSTIESQPSVGKNWATSLCDGLGKGLKNYYSSITSDVTELDLKA